MSQPPVPPPTSSLAKDFPRGSSTKMPRLIYGTAWKGEETADLVYRALKVGFRGIDTAAQPKHYREDLVAEGVRRAISEGIVSRKDLYIQSKFTPKRSQDLANLPYDPAAPLEEQVAASVASSLRNFTVSSDEPPYLDCLILHSPLDTDDDTLAVWRALQPYVPRQIGRLGISNTPLVTLRLLVSASEEAGGENFVVEPSVVQNRFTPQTGHETALRAYCRRHKRLAADGVHQPIIFQSFWTLSANRNLLRSECVTSLAAGAGVTNEAALYGLVLGLECTAVLDGTKNHMREDLDEVEKLGVWADGEGKEEWRQHLSFFRKLIKDGDF